MKFRLCKCKTGKNPQSEIVRIHASSGTTGKATVVVGQLQELLEVICKSNINVKYMYALSIGTDDASIVLKTSDLDKAAELLKNTDVELVDAAELQEIV